MRKSIALIYLFLSSYFFVNAQMTDSIAWRKVDRVNQIIKTAKGKKLVDCYNLLAECYLCLWENDVKHLDTARMYANKAYEQAKTMNYATGVGYAKAVLTWSTVSKIKDAEKLMDSLKKMDDAKANMGLKITQPGVKAF